jgi:hypothetical protein
MYIALINIPGYMPMDDEPPTFENAWDAWDYLADIRREFEDSAELPGDTYSDTVLALEANSMRLMADGTRYNYIGTVYGPSPLCEADDPYDLGYAYTVDICEDE